MLSRFSLIVALVLVLFQAPHNAFAAGADDKISVSESDWAWWRGPTRNGVAPANQNPPTAWSDETNILWKTAVPGRGHGSPTVVGDRIFLATADEAQEIQSVLCFDRDSGKQQWKTDIHTGGFESVGRQGNVRSTKASSTVACDGQRIYINFINDNAVYLTALSLEGKQLWQNKVTDYTMHQGYGASPTVYGSLVIASADNKGGGAVAAYDRVSGDLVWKQERAELPNYASPIILNVHGSDQLVLTGQNKISSYAPLTGKKLWEVDGATTECVTSVVSDGAVVVTSGGYPDKHISVVRGDGSGETLWRNETMVYVPSMLVHDGHLYAVTDSGETLCYDLKTGEIVWEDRIRSKFAASLVLVGDHIYAAGDNGSTYVFKASPSAFELVSTNSLGVDEVQATPTICGGKVYMRVALGKGEDRKEMLYCIGQ